MRSRLLINMVRDLLTAPVVRQTVGPLPQSWRLATFCSSQTSRVRGDDPLYLRVVRYSCFKRTSRRLRLSATTGHSRRWNQDMVLCDFGTDRRRRHRCSSCPNGGSDEDRQAIHVGSVGPSIRDDHPPVDQPSKASLTNSRSILVWIVPI